MPKEKEVSFSKQMETHTTYFKTAVGGCGVRE